jgi:peptidoglycan/LPS O-acetylase OafA/YrhL
VFHFGFLTLFAVANTPDAFLRLNRLVAALVATVATAALSYRFLERPFLKLKQSVTRVNSGHA